MIVKSVFDNSFKRYGTVLKGFELDDFTNTLIQQAELPEEGYGYVASVQALEEHPLFIELQKRVFGGLPMQLGYCAGNNTIMNCVEYHKCSEVCVMAHDTVLLLGRAEDIENAQYNLDKIEAFLVPANTAVELFPGTLHYAPCNTADTPGFRVAVALLKGTCGAIEHNPEAGGEDKFLFSANKWLLTHPHSDTEEAKSEYACVGVSGDEIDIKTCIRK